MRKERTVTELKEYTRRCTPKTWYHITDKLIDDLLSVGWDGDLWQVKEKFGCYDEETEVLTKSGWKYFKEVDYSDEFITLSQDHREIQYQKALDIMSHDYDGDMYVLEGRGVNIKVTPNHKLLCSKPPYGSSKNKSKREYPFKLERADKKLGQRKCFLKGVQGGWKGTKPDKIEIDEYCRVDNVESEIRGNYTREYYKPPKKYDTNEFMKFLGWFISEGCAGVNRGEISIAFNNTDDGTVKRTISNILDKLGIKYSLSNEHKSAGIFKIYDIQLNNWLIENCGHLAQNKKIPDIVKDLDSTLIKEFLFSLYQGDGHKSKTSHRLYTVSKQLSDDVQELILKCGYSSCVEKVEPKTTTYTGNDIIGNFPCYVVGWLKNNTYITPQKTKVGKNYREALEHYSGKVYCVTVPNHILFVRRGGKTYFCGNSLRFYIGEATEHMLDLIDAAEDRTKEICIVCGEPSTCASSGWITYLCDEHKEGSYKCQQRRNSSTHSSLTGWGQFQ